MQSGAKAGRVAGAPAMADVGFEGCKTEVHKELPPVSWH